MNYDEMKFIDTDIREALRRIYANNSRGDFSTGV